MTITRQPIESAPLSQHLVDAKIEQHRREGYLEPGVRAHARKTQEFEYGGDDMVLHRANRPNLGRTTDA